ncbi:hypothetical protein PAXRUDRAFT_154208 [Paxillus rubicundulus Ve08.2h10]|uniref:Unplaced genomic scaffold scaffold_834, whole genome shotgun sequence n=1 Tax=Paxillus rubicundulus Ve08.2h10 TaxID=930991 RepID=A0A0D0D2F4_9AGAM|nr:hypothetical protein PAXRUDRAFT_154208 [Paxillus rubicundulus Ve08.2h10]
MATNRFIAVHFTTIFEHLKCSSVSRKKLKRIASERNEDRRAEFIAHMAQYNPDELGFIDETSKDERTAGWRYGHSRRGKRTHKKQPFIRGRRVTIEALLTLDGIISGTVVEGLMTQALFLEWLEFVVLPRCSRYPGPLSILMMDNAKIHHGAEILELADRFGEGHHTLPLLLVLVVTLLYLAHRRSY